MCPTPLLCISSALCFMCSVPAAGLDVEGSLISPWGPGAAILHRTYGFYATSEALEEGLKTLPQTL